MISKVHIELKDGDTPHILQDLHEVIFISIPFNKQHQCSTITYNSDTLSIFMTRYPKHWQIEGKLKVR